MDLYFFIVPSLYYNVGQDICRLFHFLAQFLFTTSETDLDYYQQKVNVQDAYTTSCGTTRNLGSLKYLDLMANTQPPTQEPKFDVFQ